MALAFRCASLKASQVVPSSPVRGLANRLRAIGEAGLPTGYEALPEAEGVVAESPDAQRDVRDGRQAHL